VFDVNVKMLTPKSRIGSDKHDYGIYTPVVLLLHRLLHRVCLQRNIIEKR
jgi:hypothetical protein